MNHLVWTIGNGDPMHGVCIPYRILRACTEQGRKQEEETTAKVVKNMEGSNLGTRGEIPKQALTIELPEGREFPYYRSD